MLTRMPVFQNLILFLSLPLLFSASSASHAPHSTKLLLPSDAVALLAFKSKADLGDKLPFSSRTRSVFCKWQGVKCSQNRAVRVVIEGLGLGGTLAPDSLIRLDQLRILSLQNNSLTGTIPDLSGLVNLKSLFLDHNAFHGPVPPSISTLHRLRTLDLAHNHLSGTIPSGLINLDRLYYLRLDSNRFEGSIPPLNQSFLQVFNVSRNNLTGAIPVTPAMLRFTTSSFRSNPGLCGEIIHIECRPIQPFFGPPSPIAPPPAAAALGQNGQLRRGAELEQRSAPQKQKHKKIAMIVGFSTGVFVLLGSVLCFIMATKKKQNPKALTTRLTSDTAANVDEAAVTRIQEDIDELEEKVMKAQFGKSGSLVFCAGESQLYSLEQLMRASAEMMGKGTMGTTYKAVLDNRLIVCVKRLDAGNLAGTSAESFNGLMESVGGLRHPNLVPLRAYFQAKDERLLVYDYQPNGSLFSLIHGSKSARARALHWTSCLKIADDVAQGLSYIHQAWRLVHGNLKSSNVLLGPDFEACLTDYCLSLLADNSPSAADDPDSAAHKAPEARRFNDQLTAKSDVYSFGVLLLELLTGKPPSQHPHVVVLDDIVNWVRSCREDGGGGGGGGGGEEEDRLEMLLEVAVVCRATSPEQRPTMWQVLKTIQEIKEAVVSEGDTNGLGPISQCRTAGPETP